MLRISDLRTDSWREVTTRYMTQPNRFLVRWFGSHIYKDTNMHDLTTFLDRYEKAKQFWPGTPSTREEAQARALLTEAVEHIKFLQSRAGAMTQGESFDDIRRRQGKQETGNDA